MNSQPWDETLRPRNTDGTWRRGRPRRDRPDIDTAHDLLDARPAPSEPPEHKFKEGQVIRHPRTRHSEVIAEVIPLPGRLSALRFSSGGMVITDTAYGGDADSPAGLGRLEAWDQVTEFQQAWEELASVEDGDTPAQVATKLAHREGRRHFVTAANRAIGTREGATVTHIGAIDAKSVEQAAAIATKAGRPLSEVGAAAIAASERDLCSLAALRASMLDAQARHPSSFAR